RGAAQPNVNGDSLKKFIFPLPPLAEQKRIVEKVNQAFSLLDTIDELQARYADNLTSLKSKLIDAAIQGKLVPQDSSEGTGEELYRRIQREKQALIQAGKIRKEKPLPEITEEEIPFEIPEGWKWVRFNDVCKRIHYGYTSSAQIGGNAKLLRITDIQNNHVNWDAVPSCSISDENLQKYQLSDGDIVIARTGGTVGKTFIIKGLQHKAVFASYLIRSEPLLNLDSRYLKVLLESPLFWSQLRVFTRGAAQPNVNGDSLKQFIFPLPPLAEQKRIVAKLDELLPLCDRLKQPGSDRS
ncbi:MAG: restriction endonuclease subunit S, partial [Thermoguttaceae bacterium]|nr:restriction endonuclease subunit S [Thermoguttaceae bacterium]